MNEKNQMKIPTHIESRVGGGSSLSLRPGGRIAHAVLFED